MNLFRLSRITFWSLLFLGLHPLMASKAWALRSEVARYKMINDKTKTEDIYRLLKHEFVLDTTGRESQGLRDLIKDGQNISNKTNAEIVTFLRRNLDSEHYGNIVIKGGIPFPRFTIKGVDFISNFRAIYDLGASLSITQTGDPTIIGGVTVAANDPFIQLYLKEDRKYGGNLEFSLPKDIDVDFFLYYLRRWDRLEALTASQITRDGRVIKLDKPKNSMQAVSGDIKINYDHGQSRFFIAAEELRFFKISDKEGTNGRLFYGASVPLFRLHGERTFQSKYIKLNAFLGLHKRSGYELGDGIYGGGEFNFGEFPLSALLIGDPEYITFNPRLRIWVFHLEYSAKIPVNERTEGNASTAALHAINFRVSI